MEQESANLRILLVDDVKIVRDALRRLLESRESWQVCGEASNGREAIDKAQELAPDVIIIDLNMPVMNGLEATRLLRKVLPAANVLILTQHDSESAMRAAAEAGAHGYLAKSQSRHLFEAVEAVRVRRPYFLSDQAPFHEPQ